MLLLTWFMVVNRIFLTYTQDCGGFILFTPNFLIHISSVEISHNAPFVH